MRNYIQPGNTLTLTAPVGGVTAGSAYKIGQILVVAACDAAAGEEFEGQTCGVFDLPKNTAQALTEGALVYWDTTPGELTTTAAGNLLVGVAVAAALAADTTGRVRLNGIGAIDS